VPRIKILVTLSLALGVAAGAAHAQIIPEPSQDKVLYVRDLDNKVVERLVPHRDRYDLFDPNRGGVAIGYAKMIDRRLEFFDKTDKVTAVARPELLPPESELSAIAVVRDQTGNKLGTLSRY
jgi:hypothetical protein